MPSGFPKNGINKGWIKKGQKLSQATKDKMSVRIPWNKGTKGVMIAWNKGKTNSGFRQGYIPWNKGKPAWNKGKKMSPLSIEQRTKISNALKGEKSYLWKGGLTTKSIQIRHSIELRLWREAVFARDNWTCRDCDKQGVRLNAHHIKSFSKYPELRFAIDNGKTLCEDCHKKTDNYLNNKSGRSS